MKIKLRMGIGAGLAAAALLLAGSAQRNAWSMGGENPSHRQTTQAPPGSQAGQVDWSQALNLSQSEEQSTDPAIAADPAGGVHVVWSEASLDGSSFITYAALKEGSWSEPNEVLTGPASLRALYPSIAADSQGYLHVAWLGESIHISRAHVSAAGSMQGWSPPAMVEYVQDYLGSPSLVCDGQDVLHLAYTIALGGNSGVYYTRSQDGGESWSEPALVYKNFRSDRMVEGVVLRTTANGWLHAAWTETDYPETFPPLGIRYAFSQDGGLGWSEAIPLAEGPYGEVELSGRGENELHAVWSGTSTDRYKFHRWSPNNGTTWSETYRNEQLGGFQGSPALAVDGSQGLHWLTVGSVFAIQNDALAHTQWQSQGWAPVDVLLENAASGQNPANAAAVVALGNQLHVVLQYPLDSATQPEGWQEEIYALQDSLAAQSSAPQELRPPPATAAASVTPAAAVPSDSPNPISDTPPQGPGAGSPLTVLVVSIAAAAGIALAGVLAARRRGR